MLAFKDVKPYPLYSGPLKMGASLEVQVRGKEGGGGMERKVGGWGAVHGVCFGEGEWGRCVCCSGGEGGESGGVGASLEVQVRRGEC